MEILACWRRSDIRYPMDQKVQYHLYVILGLIWVSYLRDPHEDQWVLLHVLRVYQNISYFRVGSIFPYQFSRWYTHASHDRSAVRQILRKHLESYWFQLAYWVLLLMEGHVVARTFEWWPSWPPVYAHIQWVDVQYRRVLLYWEYQVSLGYALWSHVAFLFLFFTSQNDCHEAQKIYWVHSKVHVKRYHLIWYFCLLLRWWVRWYIRIESVFEQEDFVIFRPVFLPHFLWPQKRTSKISMSIEMARYTSVLAMVHAWKIAFFDRRVMMRESLFSHPFASKSQISVKNQYETEKYRLLESLRGLMWEKKADQQTPFRFYPWDLYTAW